MRGLKLHPSEQLPIRRGVALYTSAWIEIAKKERAATPIKVALYTSAWIEITGTVALNKVTSVALYTSAWIEIT